MGEVRKDGEERMGRKKGEEREWGREGKRERWESYWARAPEIWQIELCAKCNLIPAISLQMLCFCKKKTSNIQLCGTVFLSHLETLINCNYANIVWLRITSVCLQCPAINGTMQSPTPDFRTPYVSPHGDIKHLILHDHVSDIERSFLRIYHAPRPSVQNFCSRLRMLVRDLLAVANFLI